MSERGPGQRPEINPTNFRRIARYLALFVLVAVAVQGFIGQQQQRRLNHALAVEVVQQRRINDNQRAIRVNGYTECMLVAVGTDRLNRTFAQLAAIEQAHPTQPAGRRLAIYRAAQFLSPACGRKP